LVSFLEHPQDQEQWSWPLSQVFGFGLALKIVFGFLLSGRGFLNQILVIFCAF